MTVQILKGKGGRVNEFRTDVRHQTEMASQNELRFHGCYLVLLSQHLAEELAQWSRPVQIKVEPGEYGMAEIIVREIRE